MSVRGAIGLAALLAAACGARGTGEYRAVEETRLDAGVGEGAAAGDSAQLAEAIARWEAKGGSAASPSADEKSCLGKEPERALTGPEMEQIFAAAFHGLLASPRFVAIRVVRGLWEGGALQANIAEGEAEGGARKIWLGEGAVERRLAYVEGGRARQLLLRSSVANPQLVASGPSSTRRDVAVLEVGARWAGAGGGEAIALVDASARLAAVLAQGEGGWRFVRFVDLEGVEGSRAALCRAIATAQ